MKLPPGVSIHQFIQEVTLGRMVKWALLAAILGMLGACANDPEVKSWWTLKDDSFIPIKPGLPKADARKILGKPLLETRFPRLNEEVWDYRYVHGTTYIYIAEVHFDAQGAVKYYTQYPDPAYYSGLW